VVERELRALVVLPTNLHQLQDAILSIWADISKECLQHLVESMPCTVELRRKRVKHSMVFPGVPNNPLGECIARTSVSLQSDIANY